MLTNQNSTSSQHFTAVGIPTQSPSSTYLTPNVTWNQTAYIFTTRNSDTYGLGSGPDGNYSSRLNCSISRITSTGQTGGENLSDGSYFGEGNGHLDIHWEQVRVGQLDQRCGANAQTGECTLRFNSNPSAWIGGVRNYPNARVSASVTNNSSGDPYATYDGIFLSSNGQYPWAIANGYYGHPRPLSTTKTIYRVDCDLAVSTIDYYPGDTDYDVNTVPIGVEEIYHSTKKSFCNAQ